jgi:hypothetical protein
MTDIHDTHDIFLRAHTVVRDTEQKNKRKNPTAKEAPWPDRILCFDCETLTDATQKLNFGAYRLCKLVNGRYLCEEEGLFYADDLPATKRKVLAAYKRHEYADIEVKSFTPKIHLVLHSRSEFVDKVFFNAILDKTMVVGFNLPFDLARIAEDWGLADDGGYSLVLCQWFNPKTAAWEEHPARPRNVYKALNSKTALIHSTRARRSAEKSKKGKVKKVALWPTGRFLDVRTLLWALRNKSYSLKLACKKLKTEHQKMDHDPTGDVTPEEIEYCRDDVKCTVEVLNAAKSEYDLHPIAKGPDQLYSPASVAKGYLEELKIAHPARKYQKRNYAFGIAMQGYMGGRAECRIRQCEVPVVPVDFMSQYPTVNELLGNWPVLTAQSVFFEDATDEVRKLLARITLDQCFQRKLWPEFKFLRSSDRITTSCLFGPFTTA